MTYAILIGIALFVFIDFAGSTIEHAVNAFLLAGIIPGTSIQLPWYVPIIAAPVLLYGLYKLLDSLLSELPSRRSSPPETVKAGRVKTLVKKITNKAKKIFREKLQKSLTLVRALYFQTKVAILVIKTGRGR